MVFFFLFSSNRPLLEFLLIPVKLQFYLLDFLIDSKDADLDIV